MTLRLSMTFINSLALTLVDTLLSLSYSLAQFTASLATHYGFYVAAACANAFMMTIIIITLAPVPPSVLPSLRGEKLSARAGDVQLAGGSGESHLTSKQTDRSRRLPVLLLLLPLFTTLTYTHQCRRPIKNSPLPRFSGSSLGGGKMATGLSRGISGQNGPSLPTVCSSFTDLSCSMTACHPIGLGDEDFTAQIAVLNFGYGGCTPPFALDGFALSLSSLSARCGLSFCFTSCLHLAFYAFANLTIGNGHLNRPFSASNCAIRCHDLLHMSNPLGSSPFSRGFYHRFACQDSVLRLADLTLKHGRLNCPFSASNCAIGCHDLLHMSNPLGFTLFHGGFSSLFRLRWFFLRLANLTLKNGGFKLPFSASNCVIRCHPLLESPSDKGFFTISAYA